MKRVILILICLAALSCVRERVETTQEQELVNLQFRALAGTRAASDPEWAVNRVAVLVFQQEGGAGDFLYKYRVEGKSIVQDNNAVVYFDALLSHSTDPVRLLAVANYPTGGLGALAADATEASVRALLVGTSLDFSQGIPMTGVAQLPSLSSATGTVRFPLMRSVAKATIAVDLNAGSPDFTLNGVSVYRTNSSWQLFPDVAAVQNEGSAPLSVAPSVASGALVGNRAEVETDASQFYSGYIAESAAPVPADAAAGACLIVRGRFQGDAADTYYRIDFGSDKDPLQPIGQVLRNYYYRFTIVGAEGSGWDNPADAALYPPSGLQITVTPWNGGDNTEYYFSDGDYIKLSADSMLLDATIDHTATMTITTSGVPFTMTSVRKPGAVPLDTATPAQMLETDIMSFKMTPLSPDNAGEQKWQLTATALTDSDSTPDYLLLHAADGMMTIRIFIQRNPPLAPPVVPVNDPTKRTIRAYSLGTNTFGSLNYDTNNGMTAILRNPNYFGPMGTVPCAGVQMLGYGTPTGAALQSMLAGVDILTTTFWYNPDAATSQIIYNWLQEPGHVLFLTSDDGSSSPNIRQLLDPAMIWRDNDDIDNDPVATYYGYGSGYSGLVTAAATTDNAPFLDGVFGNANNCARPDDEPYDTVTLYMNTTSAASRAQIVPLVVPTGSAGPNNNVAVMAVDPTRRVVYMGEVLWFHKIYTWWSNTTPYDSTDYINVMMSNTWAWAVEKVMVENYDVPGMTDI